MFVPQLLLDQRGRLEPELIKIGDTWDDLIQVVGETAGKRVVVPTESGPSSRPENNIIIWGEYDAYRGLDKVITLLGVHGGKCTLIISGGNYRPKTHGETGALDLWRALKDELQMSGWTGKDVENLKSNLIIDSFSKHTGHQRQILGGIILGFKPQRVIVVQPRCHITRFMMSLARNIWKEDRQPFQIHGCPVIQPLPHGEWDTPHTGRAPIEDPTRRFTYAELLALPPTRSRDSETFICGEIDKIIQYAGEGQCLTFRQARQWL